MKKLLFVIGIVAMFTLTASAKKTPTTTYNFQFLTANGDPYCDGMVLKNYGNPQTLVDGIHFDLFCFQEIGIEVINAGVNGFIAPVASNYQYGGSGPVMIVSDLGVAYFGCESLPTPTPIHSTDSFITCPNVNVLLASTYLINPATNTWTLWVSGAGTGEFVANYGTLQPAVSSLIKTAPSVSPSQLPKSSLMR